MLRRVWVIGLVGGTLAALVGACADYGPNPAQAACEAMLAALGRAPAAGSTPGCQNLAQAVADGGIVFDPSLQTACQAEARAATPPGLLTPSWLRQNLPSCAAMFSGRRRVDEGCRVTLECAAEGYCDSSGATCPGTCRAYAARGEDCGAGRGACDPSQDACDLTCAALALADEACGPRRGCAPGLSCVERVCLVPQPEGGRCDLAANFGRGCEQGLFCAQDGRCQAPREEVAACLSLEELGVLLGLGGTAGGLGLLGYAQCAAGLACQHGACLPLGTRGVDCDPADWPSCEQGMGCDPLALECTALRPPGATCELGGLGCQAGAFCQRETDALVGTCTPLLAPGETCASPFECQAGLTCREALCAPDRCRDFLTPTLSSAAAVPGHAG
ncbi:MAG TPA: hypothetical protein PK668_05655 [Myxococcota bacterium]|nr:hypothetical protein [Myxococcota bacterium]HRY92675.1 hypothetical protein [Myxococcota bacterium]HSA21641.1 hypothetical protein [Myxococcota bacterium]